MAILLREAEVRALVSMPEMVDAVEQCFRKMAAGESGLIPRRRLIGPSGTFHLMAGSLTGSAYVAFKAYTATASGVRFLVGLFDLDDGRLLALMEGDWLGRLRTGAATGVAVKHLAFPGSKVLGIVGAGKQAFTQVLAVNTVCQLTEVKVASRTAESAWQLCQLLDEEGITAKPVASVREACLGSDVVVTATTSRDPVISRAWLEPHALVAAVGSNWHHRREVDDDTVRDAELIVVDSLEQAKVEAGDLIIPMANGVRRWSDVVELAEVVGGRVSRPNDGIVLFKSVGLGTEDAAAAVLVYRKAVEAGYGEEIGLCENLLP